jgi:hypothetical protein
MQFNALFMHTFIALFFHFTFLIPDYAMAPPDKLLDRMYI